MSTRPETLVRIAATTQLRRYCEAYLLGKYHVLDKVTWRGHLQNKQLSSAGEEFLLLREPSLEQVLQVGHRLESLVRYTG